MATVKPAPRHDPHWDLEGPTARREWRRRRLRRIQAALAWLDVGAVSAFLLRFFGH